MIIAGDESDWAEADRVVSLDAPIRTGLLLATALLAFACASPAPPEKNPSYQWSVAPYKAYAGAPRARDRVAVIRLQDNPEIAGFEGLIVRAIDAEEIPKAWAYALLPGPHSLEVATLRKSEARIPERVTPVTATLQVDVSGGDLLGVRVAPGGEQTVELVDQDLTNKLIASAPLEAEGPERVSCGLGFELALLAAWRRRGKRAPRARPAMP